MNKKRLIACLAALIMLVAAFMLMGVSCSASSANIKNLVMTTGVDENSQPVDSVTEFAAGTDIYASAELHNAPEGTVITAVWYVGGEEVDRISFDNQGYTDTMIYSYMTADMTQAGDYSVAFFIDEREEPDVTASFTVK